MVKEKVSEVLRALPAVERLVALGMIIALAIVVIVLSGCAAKFEGSLDSPTLSSWLTGEPVQGGPDGQIPEKP